jgi:hypothetical protein
MRPKLAFKRESPAKRLMRRQQARNLAESLRRQYPGVKVEVIDGPRPDGEQGLELPS